MGCRLTGASRYFLLHLFYCMNEFGPLHWIFPPYYSMDFNYCMYAMYTLSLCAFRSTCGSQILCMCKLYWLTIEILIRYYTVAFFIQIEFLLLHYSVTFIVKFLPFGWPDDWICVLAFSIESEALVAALKVEVVCWLPMGQKIWTCLHAYDRFCSLVN